MLEVLGEEALSEELNLEEICEARERRMAFDILFYG